MSQEIVQLGNEMSTIKSDISKITYELSLLRSQLTRQTLELQLLNPTAAKETPNRATSDAAEPTSEELKALREEVAFYKKNACYPPGHYYSPIVSVDDIKSRETEIWNKTQDDKINGVDLRADEQKRLLQSLSDYYSELPFAGEKQPGLRYYFENGFYSYTDGIILYAMMRHFKPKRIVEIGSGFSSAVMLDTNQLFFENQINLTFIEPNPERLYAQLHENDKAQTTIHRNLVQSVPLDIFRQLEKGDILFIDSSHVVKTGSDVHYILFQILPILNNGVIIHFHDIFFPFEYPRPWVYEGRNWNEAYFLKSFLMYNAHFKIRLFAHYLHTRHKESFSSMPLCYKNQGGNIWIEKL